ncbi:hypothetical protein M5K25_021620 [Dendrobium thyrsiflorum]|uniref:Transmembrane protein 230 n=1 Tax=Dendrobium thyrsiflorum TaxID=117978 RepID=A0ABD0UCX9_DENTH
MCGSVCRRWGSVTGEDGMEVEIGRLVVMELRLDACTGDVGGSVELLREIERTVRGLPSTCVLTTQPSDDRGIFFAGLGSVLFLPGFYYTRIAYYAYKGYKDFSFDNIPPV